MSSRTRTGYAAPKVVDCSDDSALADARTESYENAARGLVAAAAALLQCAREGDHVGVLALIIHTRNNCASTAEALGTLVTKRAAYEFHRAGGVVPADREGKAELARKLFPDHGPAADPVAVAREYRGKGTN